MGNLLNTLHKYRKWIVILFYKFNDSWNGARGKSRRRRKQFSFIKFSLYFFFRVLLSLTRTLPRLKSIFSMRHVHDEEICIKLNVLRCWHAISGRFPSAEGVGWCSTVKRDENDLYAFSRSHFVVSNCFPSQKRHEANYRDWLAQRQGCFKDYSTFFSSQF